MNSKLFSNLNSSPIKSNTNNKLTKVLLICVFNISNNLITHDIIYRHFSNYGLVNKVNIPLNVKLIIFIIDFDF